MIQVMTHVAHLDVSLRYPVSHIAHSSNKQILVITNSWLSHIPDRRLSHTAQVQNSGIGSSTY